MKKTKLILTWVLYMISMYVMAQPSQLEYRPFAQDGKTWVARMGYTPEDEYYNKISGDTLINGEHWKKVYNSTCGFEWAEFISYYAAVRDEGKRVYAIARGSKKPRLLYDFNLKVGDFIRCGIEGNAFGCLLDNEPLDSLLGFPLSAYLYVERIDTVMAEGQMQRRFTLNLLDGFMAPYRNTEEELIEVVWIEGVGSGAGPFSPWRPTPSLDSYFLNCYINKNTIYAFPDIDYTIKTNALPDSYTFSPKEKESYDLQGRPVQSTSKHGVYIKDGRKVIK